MAIERDKWLYVATDTAKRAIAFFGFPPDTEVRPARAGEQPGTPLGHRVWAVKAPV